MRAACFAFVLAGCINFEQLGKDCVDQHRCAVADAGSGGGSSTGGGGPATGGGSTLSGGGSATGGGGGGSATGGGSSSGPTMIYRSIGQTAALASGATNAVTISAGVATFTTALPDRVSVGDGLQLDSANGSNINTIVFISRRTDNQHYDVRTPIGTLPTNVTTPNTSWTLLRAYDALWKAVDATTTYPNDNFASAVAGFDTTGSNRDLVGSNLIWNFAVSGDQEAGGGAGLAHWNTDADHYVRIFAPKLPSEVGISQRHSGVWDDTKARLDGPQQYPQIQGSWQDWRVEGMQLRNTWTVSSTDDGPYGIGMWGENTWYATDNIIVFAGSGYAGVSGIGYLWGRGHPKIYAINNIISGFPSCGIGAYAGGDVDQDGGWVDLTIVAYNNTLIANGRRGVYTDHEGGGTMTLHASNNIAIGNPEADFAGTATQLDGSNNLSGDTSAVGTTPHLSANVAFKRPDAGDYRLSSADTAAKGHGTDLSADPLYPFNDDATGQTRSAPWDIGATVPVP